MGVCLDPVPDSEPGVGVTDPGPEAITLRSLDL